MQDIAERSERLRGESVSATSSLRPSTHIRSILSNNPSVTENIWYAYSLPSNSTVSEGESMHLAPARVRRGRHCEMEQVQTSDRIMEVALVMALISPSEEQVSAEQERRSSMKSSAFSQSDNPSYGAMEAKQI